VDSLEPAPVVAAEKRGQSDRRRRPTPPFGAFLGPGRRRGFRRAGEGVNAYVDRPSGRTIAWALSVMVLSATDALLTLLHIRAGGDELVPTMRLALDHGEMTFTTTKMLITSIGVVFLALHENFPLARVGIRLLLGVYAALMGYHLLLIALR
jgi:hypothetical protein